MEISVKDIVKKYGKKEVLKGVSFTAHSGQCIGILEYLENEAPEANG